MALLTDPGAGSGKIIQFLLKWERPLCFCLYVSGIVWILLLALPIFNDNNYFSENALLPGLVTKESNLEQIAKQYYVHLLHEMKRYPDNMPYTWLLATLNQLHLDVFTHNFTLIYPFQEQEFTGQNIYGIMRAPRAASTEAIVISVPFRPINSIYLDTAPSVALLLAFAKFCRRQKYWAKDIVFLITEHEQLGIQAWLDAYHGVTSGTEGILVSGDLSGRAGSIQTAINLELHSMKEKNMYIYLILSLYKYVEGLNGRLPNLDLFNLAQNMIAKEGIRQSFQRRFDVKYKNKFKNWWYHFKTLLMMITTQASGIPTGNHGLFHRFGIEAITLEGFEKAGQQSSGGNIYQVGRIVESIVRSLNNLLERFHQSFFFYLLPSTDTYISIGLYIRSLVLIIAGIFVKAFSMWQRLQVSTAVENKTSTAEEYKKSTTVKRPKNDGFDIGVITSEILWAHICGIVIATSPFALTYFGRKTNFRTEDSIYFGFMAITVLTLMWPLYSRRQMKYKNAALVCVIVLIELGTILMCIAMHNFSLALLIAVVYVPAILAITPQQRSTKFRKIISSLWILLHPFMISSIIVICYTYVHFSTDPFLLILFRGYRAAKQAFVFSIIDSVIYGNWLYNVIVSTMLPIWLLFWNILCSKSSVHS
ncbi:PREDICTED: glycosylphosphatidylinositol anchor attachment 1 protein [Habropoda laboriosa]|uniref:glycosylphosphatidylinositol anchor attachment 1 protein n=1 Tax=Habropoda laboriosa TaxID=597456 RepID=UPI00083D0B47|nr:PREDICTED: glycosylphosphatidylinositol anchor attachment 1 protein [Habropoda laboriosa]